MLTDDERNKLLIAWNSTAAPYPELILPQLFEGQVRQTPERPAVRLASPEQSSASLSYKALNERANQLAHYLQSIGVEKGTFVGIYLERSLEMFVALLGVLKAGGAYLPLDPIYPLQRIAFMLEDAGVSIVLTQEGLVESLPVSPADKICLDSEWHLVDSFSKTNPVCPAAMEGLAYLIYTSGSTGKPKGVQVPHRALVNFLYTMRREPGLSIEDSFFAVTTLSFDIAALELFLPLICGAQVIMAGREVVGDGNLLQHYLAQSEATVMQATPATWRLLIESGWQGDDQLKILCGGEALPRNLADELLDRGASVWNLYGPTETTIWSTRHRVTKEKGAVPIGRPIGNTQLYLLDSDLQLVPIGLAGELCIGGDGLAWGYYHRPGLTAERFIPNPFCNDSGGRLYKTGDLVRYRRDGTVEFLGRIDHQVKIRGYRIELGEIEATLAQYPGLQKSIVVARNEPPDEKRLVAYSVPDTSSVPNQSELRRFLEEKLPAYMIPTAFIFLDSFPLTPNGKIDQRALPAPTLERPHIDTAYLEPRSRLERLLVEMWQQTLTLEKVGVFDNFFELGGDSLKGAFFISHLQERLDSYIYIAALFEAPTVAELATYLQTHYPEAVAVIEPAQPGKTEFAAAAPNGRINNEKIAEMRRWLATTMSYSVQNEAVEPKNPPAIFILSAPRSGTTLLRVVLAGHSRLFAPPELDLLTFPTLAARHEALAKADSFRLEGTIRAIMAVHHCNVEQAQKIMAEFEARNLTTQQFYARLQEWVAPQILVDKSITYANNLETLERAEEYFENALYIHLLRHPYGMIHSFEDVRLDRIYFREQQQFSVRELGELTWLINHQNILTFLKKVPAERQYRLKYETLVQEPEKTAKALSSFLGLDYHPGMLRPYEDRQKRMTDGIHGISESRMIGDVKFHGYSGIEAAVADRWKEDFTVDFLSEETWQIAEQVGYSERLPGSEYFDPLDRQGTMGEQLSAVQTGIEQEEAAELLSQLDHLSDEEVQALLSKMLET